MAVSLMTGNSLDAPCVILTPFYIVEFELIHSLFKVVQ